MLKKIFPFSNPVGLIVSSAVLILTLSPEARKGTRKLLVKGAGAALALGDQMKGLTTGMQKQLGTFVNEVQTERETMILPEMNEMVKEGDETVKHSFEEETTKPKQVMETAVAAEGLFEDMESTYRPKQFTAYNVLDDYAIQMKLHEIEQQLH